MFRKRALPLFVLISILFACKTYIVYQLYFQIDLENTLQQIILLMNSFVVSFAFFSLSVWIKRRKFRHAFLKYGALIGTVILYVNIVFYRSFTDFITLPQLFQMNNIADLTSSIFSLIKWYDIFLFIDVYVIWRICKYHQVHHPFVTYTRKAKKQLILVILLLLSFNLLLAEMERPQLLSRGYDREYIVKNIGIFYYHIYDVFVQSKMRTQRIVADESILDDITTYIQTEVKGDQQSELYGIAKDRNIFFISAESLQSFVINETLHGEEITPFLNQLTKDDDTFYFKRFYHQTGQGKTSDSEFIIENSLYPLPSGAVFFTHAQNEFHSLSRLIEPLGYHSYVFHANNQTFWNRNQMYQQFNIEHFFDKSYYQVESDMEVGWGLKDKDFFMQSMNYIKELNTPFYAKMITITNHFPFDLDEVDRTLEPFDSQSNTLNNYFPTVRYMDEAIELFFEQLKEAGIYDNSIIIIMGDHNGISANHNHAMAQFLGKEEITPYDYFQLQQVPLYIHIPGYGKAREMDDIAGQIDVKPTILHMLGMERTSDLFFGSNLFHDERKGFIAFRNGHFITDDYLYANGICYDVDTAEILFEDHESKQDGGPCHEWKSKVEQELSYSDQIIYGDLIRFIEHTDGE